MSPFHRVSSSSHVEDAAPETAAPTTWAEAAASPSWRAMEGYLLNYEREERLAERKKNFDAMMGAMQEAREAKEMKANMKKTKRKERDEKDKQKLKDPAVRRLIKAEVKQDMKNNKEGFHAQRLVEVRRIQAKAVEKFQKSKDFKKIISKFVNDKMLNSKLYQNQAQLFTCAKELFHSTAVWGKHKTSIRKRLNDIMYKELVGTFLGPVAPGISGGLSAAAL